MTSTTPAPFSTREGILSREYMHALNNVDGIRRTWTRMLDTIKTGSGLMPWVSDLLPCEGFSTLADITRGAPTITPAFVEWVAPTDADTLHWGLPFPFVIAKRLEFPGSNSYRWPTTSLNGTTECRLAWHEDDIIEVDGLVGHGLAIPLWSVTPLATEQSDLWRERATTQWDASYELEMLGDATGCMCTMEHVPIVQENPDGTHTDALCNMDPDNTDPGAFTIGCTCGATTAFDLLTDRLYDGYYLPVLGSQFTETWERTVGRWTLAWSLVGRLATANCDAPHNAPVDPLTAALSPFKTT